MSEHKRISIVEFARHWNDTLWPDLYEQVRSLNQLDRDETLRALFEELISVEDDEQDVQDRLINLMMQADETKSMLYFRTLLQTSNSSLIKCHILWILEGRADASWLPDLSSLLLHDTDAGVRIAAVITLAHIRDIESIPALEHAALHDQGEHDGDRVCDVARQILLRRRR